MGKVKSFLSVVSACPHCDKIVFLDADYDFCDGEAQVHCPFCEKDFIAFEPE